MSNSDSNDTELTSNALDMALEFRNPTESLIQYSGRDNNYTAKDYRRALAK